MKINYNADTSHTRLVTAEFFKMHYIYVEDGSKTAIFQGEKYKVLMSGPSVVRVIKYKE